MRKTLILFFVMAIMIVSGCGKTIDNTKNSTKFDEHVETTQTTTSEPNDIDETSDTREQSTTDRFSNKNSAWQGGQKNYAELLKNLYETKEPKDAIRFAYKDLNNDKVSELIVSYNGPEITVYSLGDKVFKIDNYDFMTGTTQLRYSNNPSYPGIFYFTVGGGMEHHGYAALRNNKLVVEELWNEDYSGISTVLGISRDRIKDLSSDKDLINESKKVYRENDQIDWKPLKSIEENVKN